MAKPNFADKTIWTGDNLDILRGMNSECVDLIYLDPPFNSNKDYAAPVGSKAAGAAFKDTWTLSDLDVAWMGLIADEQPAIANLLHTAGLTHGKGMQSYLTMMAVRLMEMRRVLKPTGSIYLHCDPTAGHYLKLLMDAVFGADKFASEITWKRTSAHSDTRQGRRQHGRVRDLLLFYTKSEEWVWNPVYTDYDPEYVANFYEYVEPETGRRFYLGDLTGPGGAIKGNPYYEFMGVTRYWRYSEERMNQLAQEGRIVQTKPGTVPRHKRYLDEMPGVPLQDLWTDIRPVQSQSRERTGYPTQKPLALLERIIKASSNEGDVVLDPFCGCATACVAAEKLGRKWVGVDLSPKAVDLVQERLRKAHRHWVLVPCSTTDSSPYAKTYPVGRTSRRRSTTGSWRTSSTASRWATARAVAGTSSSGGWRWTTSSRAPGAARTTETTCRCCARTATASRATGTRRTWWRG